MYYYGCVELDSDCCLMFDQKMFDRKIPCSRYSLFLGHRCQL